MEFAPELFMMPPSYNTYMTAEPNTVYSPKDCPPGLSRSSTDTTDTETLPAPSTCEYSNDFISSTPLTSWSGLSDLDDRFAFVQPPWGNDGAIKQKPARTAEQTAAALELRKERRRQQNRTAQQVYRARQLSLLNSFRYQRDCARAEAAELKQRLAQHEQTYFMHLQTLRKELLATLARFNPQTSSVTGPTRQIDRKASTAAEISMSGTQQIYANTQVQAQAQTPGMKDSTSAIKNHARSRRSHHHDNGRQYTQNEATSSHTDVPDAVQRTVSMAELAKLSPVEELNTTLLSSMAQEPSDTAALSLKQILFVDTDCCRTEEHSTEHTVDPPSTREMQVPTPSKSPVAGGTLLSFG